jgi:hypothetical protein
MLTKLDYKFRFSWLFLLKYVRALLIGPQWQRDFYLFILKVANVCLMAVDIYHIVNARLLERPQLVYYLTPLIRLFTYVIISFGNRYLF